MTGQQFYEGAAVHDVDGEKIGTLHAYDAQGGYIVVQKGFLFHKDLYIPVNAVQSTDAEGTVQLSLHKDDLADDRYASAPTGGAAREDSYAQRAPVSETTETTTTRTQATPQPAPARRQAPAARADDTINVPVYEEELVVGKQREEMGRVHLHKETTQEQVNVPVTLQREEVTIERVPMKGEASKADLTDAFQNRDIDMTVMGEEAVVGKRLEEVEEVRLRKDTTQEQQNVTDTVRKERVVVDQIDETRGGATESNRPTNRR